MYEIWGEIVISIRVLKSNIKTKKQGIKLKPVDIDEVNNIFVDGSDITPFIRLMGYGANGLTAFVVSVGYGIATLILSLIITSFTAIIPMAVMTLVCAFSGIVYLSKMRGLTE